MDVISQLAYPLPVIAIGKMLGVPTESRQKPYEWSEAIRKALDFTQSPEDREVIFEKATKATLESNAFLRALIAERREHPQDDLLTSLITAEEEADKLTEDELSATCTLLLWAGHVPPANLIGNGVYALLTHPEQLEKLRANPELIGTAVDEVVRYDSPSQMSFRFAFEDIEFGDKVIRKGQQVGIVFGAANRDPEQSTDADQFDVARAENHHVGFGPGSHYCVGKALARIEGKVAITKLFERFPQLKLQPEGVRWDDATGLRGLASLPISF